MSISFNCECGKPLKSKEEMAGRKTKCPHCGAILTIPGTLVRAATAPRVESANPAHPDALRVEGLDWTSPEASATATVTAIATESASASAMATTPASGVDSLRRPDLPRPDDGSKQYKVLGQRDHSASGKLNFASMEATLNEQAHHGWVMKAAFVVNVPGHSGSHDEVVLILER
ncbi:protein of unknown function [Singulisphaera sp. GP187]|uniref:DUF4177 domain-containing protein n=1 Tax=Singulisphaera sp. GP187 TaxID=1882752 RepID=UPI000927B7C9|nr:DUF4177 domain-containing protein [Singulisphaera sp. GP187]SIO15975.1 protein of unknown function [Singulisphaera sp. GP187]